MSTLFNRRSALWLGLLVVGLLVLCLPAAAQVLPPGAPKYTAVEVLHNNERVAYIEPIPEIV